jgi:hypothetical protein
MENFQISELENTIITLSNAVDRCYAESPEGDFMAFEDLVYDMGLKYKALSRMDENPMEDASQERDEAFYERFNHLGSI